MKTEFKSLFERYDNKLNENEDINEKDVKNKKISENEIKTSISNYIYLLFYCNFLEKLNKKINV